MHRISHAHAATSQQISKAVVSKPVHEGDASAVQFPLLSHVITSVVVAATGSK